MSLRDQLKDALDAVAPPAPTLERRVTAFVFADKPDRRTLLNGRRRGRSTNRFPGVAALVAVGLVVTLVAGIAIGGRLGPDLGNGESPRAYTIDQSELHSLESRPILLPVLAPGASCPFSPLVQSNLPSDVLGSGPVYAFNSWYVSRTDQVDWVAFAFYYLAQGPGLVLVRARDLHTSQAFVFSQYPIVDSGAIATGSVLGTDRLMDKTIQLHPEAVLKDPWHLDTVNQELVVMFAIPRATLCWGFQFDGPGFRETIVDGWDDLSNKT